MTSVKFVIADVFTRERFGGNQLAVFTNAAGLDSDTMQKIALEMNYSETTFLLPPESGGDLRVRIFTPARELPFAGHPLVGSGFVVAAEGMKQAQGGVTSVALETGVGPIQVEIDSRGHTTMTQPVPSVRGTFADLGRLARALSLEENDLDASHPVEAVYNGLTVLVAPIRTRAAVERISIDSRALAQISRETGGETVLAFTRETVDPKNHVHCRVFAPAAGVMEDAATGSANGPLGFYLVRHRLVEAEPVTRIISEQGYEMNRPSILQVEVHVDQATGNVIGVRVGGGVIITARGELYLS
ncbi:MAG TPA: PhzF family phenazine biosynthesis protein [Blastocatellia bacterium]|nr:PhzF family phenazine biosynthesis protein [Blastocatellia bacterium]